MFLPVHPSKSGQSIVEYIDQPDFNMEDYREGVVGENKQLADSNLQIRTVYQVNVAGLPRPTGDGSTISYAASGNSVSSMGPEIELADSFVTDGAFGEKTVTLTATPSKTLPK